MKGVNWCVESRWRGDGEGRWWVGCLEVVVMGLGVCIFWMLCSW